MSKTTDFLEVPVDRAGGTGLRLLVFIWMWAMPGMLTSCATRQHAPVVYPPVAVRIKEARLDKPFVISSKIPWNETGIQMVKGCTYQVCVEATGAEPYTDGGIPADADGVRGWFGRLFDRMVRDATGRDLVSRWVAFSGGRLLKEGDIHRLRVLADAQGRKAHFLTLIAAVGHDDSACSVVVIGKGGTFTAPKSGELTLFSNDWPGGKGTDLQDDARFMNSPTYANNTGHLRITVSPVSCSR